MTSTNHFRGRQLGTNRPPPLAPRHYRRPFYPPPPPQPPAIVTWVIDVNKSGVHSIVALRTDTLIRQNASQWWLNGTDQAGRPNRIMAVIDKVSPFLLTYYLVDWGSGLDYSDDGRDFTYTGVEPFTGPTTNWFHSFYPGTGNFQVTLPQVIGPF